MVMSFEEARSILDGCDRNELRDRTFGDTEYTFVDDEGNIVADGYSGPGSITVDIDGAVFTDGEAEALLSCGTRGIIEMNDADDDNDDYVDDEIEDLDEEDYDFLEEDEEYEED